jgi:hypothetical protein
MNLGNNISIPMRPGPVASCPRTPFQHAVRGLDAPAAYRPSGNDLDRIAFAARLAWPRCAGLWPDGQTDRPAR